jgi:hypothetical protein
MRISQWTYLGFEINHLLDAGEKLSFDQVRAAMEKKELIELLDMNFKDRIDLSLIKNEDRNEMEEEFNDISIALFGNERRKFGIENNGLCLIQAYIIEYLQKNRPDK